MTPALALFLAMLAPQATPPVTQPTSAPPALQTVPLASPSSSSPAAQPNPDTNTTPLRRIGGGVSPPRVIYQVPPEFTKEARKSKMSGVTLVNLIVDPSGNPQNVHVARSMADTVDKKHRKAALTLDQKAVDAVKQYRFEPALFQGKPVPVQLNVEVNFHIF
jgi:TonB family protein